MSREQHERKCPACGEWMSATAPKCLNCGRRVDEAEDDTEANGTPSVPWRRVLAFVGLIGVIVVVAFFVRPFRGCNQQDPAEAEAERRQRELGKFVDPRGSLNDTSAVTWAEVEPREEIRSNDIQQPNAHINSSRFSSCPREKESNTPQYHAIPHGFELTLQFDGLLRRFQWPLQNHR